MAINWWLRWWQERGSHPLAFTSFSRRDASARAVTRPSERQNTQAQIVMAQNALPAPSEVNVEDAKKLDAPTHRIRMEDDVGTWKSTRGYQDYLLFLHRLSESVVGHSLPHEAKPNEDEDSLSPVWRSFLLTLQSSSNL